MAGMDADNGRLIYLRIEPIIGRQCLPYLAFHEIFAKNIKIIFERHEKTKQQYVIFELTKRTIRYIYKHIVH